MLEQFKEPHMTSLLPADGVPDSELGGQEQGVPPYDGLHQLQADVLKLITLQHLSRTLAQIHKWRSQKQTLFLRSNGLSEDFF